FEVPTGQKFWMTDYQFAVGRQSGIDAGDFVYAEEGRFSGQMGFDVTVNNMYRIGDLEYGLDPAPIPLGRPEFQPSFPQSITRTTSADVFSAAAAASFASTAGPGTSLLPVRPNVQGPREGPFTWVVDEGNQVALRCVVFRPLRTPIAFI